MELIKRIEISYFRSIYKEKLDQLKGTNVLFGRNDAGKSNVLRALNLFFNNETNPGQGFAFEHDFCHARLAEADSRRDIRKFAYVKLWVSTPESWRPSLGDEFWIKKQWSVTRETDPLFDSSIGERRLQQYLTRFLNKVRFHYVPAVKDRRIFEHLLGEIYRVVASQQAFEESLADFAAALRARTGELTQGLLKGVGVNSIISPPDDLTDLFESLDFETNTEQGDSYSLTLQRGDGIQMRHIPAILAFISDKSTEDYHLWGFEEPENSLELANAIKEAEAFCRYGEARNKQVFLTSHSPAFFALDDGRVSRYFVSRSEEHGDRRTSKLRKLTRTDWEGPGELMGETPHLPVISSYLSEAHGQIESLRAEGDRLAEELREGMRSLVFVEGKSDELVLGAAWELLTDIPQPFRFESTGGTTKMESLAKDGRVINRLAPQRTLLVVVDNDKEGRQLYKNGNLNGGGRWVTHNSNGVHWCRLPFLASFENFMRRCSIPKAYWPGSLENLFEPTLRERALEAGALRLSKTPYTELLEPGHYSRIGDYLPPSPAEERHFVLTPEHDTKLSFARWVVAKAEIEPSILSPLLPVMRGIHEILVGPLTADSSEKGRDEERGGMEERPTDSIA